MIDIGKVMLSTPETAVENFLHAMVTASSEQNVEHSIDSRLEHFKLCGITTVFDVVENSYRFYQARRYDCMYERTEEMKLVAVCNPAYELFCKVGDIWFLHQHHMQPSHQRSFMTPSQRRMVQDNRRDMGAVTVEAERNNRVSDNISMDMETAVHLGMKRTILLAYLITVVYILTSRLVMVNIYIEVRSVKRRS
jgi:hypothetical protein